LGHPAETGIIIATVQVAVMLVIRTTVAKRREGRCYFEKIEMSADSISILPDTH